MRRRNEAVSTSFRRPQNETVIEPLHFKPLCRLQGGVDGPHFQRRFTIRGAHQSTVGKPSPQPADISSTAEHPMKKRRYVGLVRGVFTPPLLHAREHQLRAENLIAGRYTQDQQPRKGH